MRTAWRGSMATLPLLLSLVVAGVHPLPTVAQSDLSENVIPEYGKWASGTASVEQLFSTLDSDGNGEIDRAEWQTRKMAIFYMRDRNNDIALSRGELPGLDGTRFAEADLNGDGALSGYEFNQAAFAQFEKADRDGDGAISADEFRSFANALETSP